MHGVTGRLVAVSRVMPKRSRDTLLSTNAMKGSLLMFSIHASSSTVWQDILGIYRGNLLAPRMLLTMLLILVVTSWMVVQLRLTIDAERGCTPISLPLS